MKTYTFYIERKATIWVKETHLVEAETEEQAKEVMLNNVRENDTEETFDQQEFLFDTLTDMEVGDNLGNPVVELYNEDMELLIEE
jgi:hypothetical protein